MRVLTSNERSFLRRKVVDGLNKLGVNATQPVVLSACDRGYLALQIVDGLHALGRSAEITPERYEREGRWMSDELREAGITFAPPPLPVPDPYGWALAALRGDVGKAPCGCVTVEVTGYTPPDPYKAAIEQMREDR